MNKIKNIIKLLINTCMDMLSDLQKINSKDDIIIIRLDAIGDFLIWLDSAKEYKKIYQEKKITLMCNDAYKEIAELLPYFDKIIPVNLKKYSKNMRYRYKLLRKIKKVKYEIAISPVYSRVFDMSDWIVRNIRAEEKIGSIGDCSNISPILKKISNKWFDILIEEKSELMMEVNRNAQFVRNLKSNNFKSSTPSIGKYIPKLDFEKMNINTSEKIILIFLGASTLKKAWPIQNFLEISKYIPEDYQIILGGGIEEKKLGEFFLKNYKRKNKIINLIGKTSILEMASLIKESNLVLGNDSSCIHMAVTVETQSICILGGGHFGRFMPYEVEEISEEKKKYFPRFITTDFEECFNCNWKCKYPIDQSWRCIEEVSVEKVKGELQKFFRGN